MANLNDFQIENGVLVKYTGAGGDVVIPEGVTSIGKSAFERCSSLTSIVIPEGVTSIGKSAFLLCEGLTSVVIPEGVTSIGESAFRRCSGLTSIVIPEGVTSIGESAFSDCKSLTSVVIPESVTSIGESAFAFCKSLPSVVIPEGVTSIEKSAFALCTSLTSVVLPESVTSIGGSAFYGCSSLTSVVFPERVSDTRDGTFASKKLKKVSIPKNVEKIGTSAFHYMCENLTLELYDTLAPFAGTVAYDMGWTGLSCAKHRIAIKDSSTDNIKYVVYMGQSNGTASQYRKAVVNGWKSDGTFDFPALDAAYSFLREASEKVEVAILRLKYPIDLSAEMKKKYEDYLKRSAKKLLSQCVQSHDMETAVFLGELGILNGDAIGAAVDICDTKDDPAMMAWLLEQQSQMPRKAKNAGGALSLSTKGKAEWQSHKDHPELVKRYQGTDTEICFPTEVKGIKITGIANSTAKLPDNYAAITAVTIPEGYTVIGENAFHGCENLETVVLPSTMKRLEKNCFKGCKALKHISIPASVEFIGDDAFSGTSIREFELLSDTEMGDYSLGSAVTLIARGKSTGCFINNHYIGYSLTYVYSDGVVKGTGIPASTIMPLSYVDIATEEAFQKTEPKILEGKTVYCLGTLKALTKGQTYFPRIQFPEFVENLGGTYAARFGKSTDILVTYEIDPENGTIQKAEQQGTMVLTELEFLKMVQEKAELEK